MFGSIVDSVGMNGDVAGKLRERCKLKGWTSGSIVVFTFLEFS